MKEERIVKIDKLQKLLKYLRDMEQMDFTGYIKINFTQGAVGRVEKYEEILKKD